MALELQRQSQPAEIGCTFDDVFHGQRDEDDDGVTVSAAERGSCVHTGMDNTNGLRSDRWGSIFWTVIHVFAAWVEFDRRKVLADAFVEWMNILTLLLPCAICRSRFEQYMSDHPLRVNLDPRKRSNWLYMTFDLHNQVDIKLHKTKRLHSSDYEAEATRYMRLFDLSPTKERLESEHAFQWQDKVSILVVLLSLNIPASFTPELPRHALIQAELPKFLALTTALLPHQHPTQDRGAGGAVDLKGEMLHTFAFHWAQVFSTGVCTIPLRRRRLKESNQATLTLSSSPFAMWTFRSWIEHSSFSRNSVFHWAHSFLQALKQSISDDPSAHVRLLEPRDDTFRMLASCREAHAVLEKEFRARD